VRGRAAIFPIAAGLLMTGCASVPTGLSVLPGTTKSFEQFQVDDAQCRQWALEQTCTTPNQAGAASTATGAAVDTAAGAGLGAAIGAAAGSPATGAAVGAGLLGGTAVGAGNAYGAGASAQNKYDIGYVQCMYAKGNQVPVPQGSKPAYTSAATPPPLPADVPPPPAGMPPPPPPGPVR